MNKLAVLVALRVVAQDRRVAQCKARTILLADKHTLTQLRGAIAFREFVGVGIRFNSHLELFGRGEGEVLDVVCINRSCFSARGGFSDGLETIPRNSVLVSIGSIIENVQDTLAYTSVVYVRSCCIPSNSSHLLTPSINTLCKQNDLVHLHDKLCRDSYMVFFAIRTGIPEMDVYP